MGIDPSSSFAGSFSFADFSRVQNELSRREFAVQETLRQFQQRVELFGALLNNFDTSSVADFSQFSGQSTISRSTFVGEGEFTQRGTDIVVLSDRAVAAAGFTEAGRLGDGELILEDGAVTNQGTDINTTTISGGTPVNNTGAVANGLSNEEVEAVEVEAAAAAELSESDAAAAINLLDRIGELTAQSASVRTDSAEGEIRVTEAQRVANQAEFEELRGAFTGLVTGTSLEAFANDLDEVEIGTRQGAQDSVEVVFGTLTTVKNEAERLGVDVSIFRPELRDSGIGVQRFATAEEFVDNQRSEFDNIESVQEVRRRVDDGMVRTFLDVSFRNGERAFIESGGSNFFLEEGQQLYSGNRTFIWQD